MNLATDKTLISPTRLYTKVRKVNISNQNLSAPNLSTEPQVEYSVPEPRFGSTKEETHTGEEVHRTLEKPPSALIEH